MRPCSTHLIRHASALGRWEIAARAPAPALGPYVRELCAFVEETPAATRRRELPTGEATVIVVLGPAIGVALPHTPEPETQWLGSFASGLNDAHVVTHSAAGSRGVQVYLTPLGAFRLLGLPMSELTNRAIGLEALLGSSARELEERLHTATSHAERLDLLEDAVARRLAFGPLVDPGVAWASRELERTRGAARVSALAATLGWSQRRLAARFREQIGLTPKRFGRVVRFRRAVERMEHDDGTSLTEIAYDCGYADQSHFVRDFGKFAGGPPSDFLGRRLPDRGGVAES